MAIGLERFRQVTSGDRVTLGAGGTGVQKSELSLGAKFKAWRNGDSFQHGTVAHQQANIQFKGEFFSALTKAEGSHIARAAVRAAGLPADWNTNPKALSAKTVAKVLDKAQEFRKASVDATNHNAKAFLQRTGAPSFAASFQAANAGGNLPAGDVGNKQLRAMFTRAVKQDPLYGKRPLGGADLDRIARNTIQKFHAQKQAGFREAHPGLAGYVQRGHAGMPREDNRSFFTQLSGKLNPATAGGHPLSTEPQTFRDAARDTLRSVESNQVLLGRMEYEPTGWNALRNELNAKHTQLQQLEAQIAGENPGTQAGQDLQQDLVAELRHQQNLVLAKRDFLDDVASKDPLSEKAAAYSNKLWAEAAGHVFDEAIQRIAADPARGPGDQAIQELRDAKAAHIAHRDIAHQTAPTNVRTVVPTAENKATHPATQAKATSVAILKTALQDAGLSKAEIKDLTSNANMGKARRLALNANPDWAGPVSRRMVVNKDGVTRTYESKITFGADISPRLARRYAATVPLTPGGPAHAARSGIASAEKADHYHARNLKVSELSAVPPQVGIGAAPPPKLMAKVVGHGVLDMWDIRDPTERAAANDRGAHEVIEVAFTTNDRVRAEALNRAAAGNTNPVKITHVSVNLTTPAAWRELPGMKNTGTFHDYQELTYTKEQFRAFAANSSAAHGGGPVTLHVDDTRPGGALGQDVAVPVEVDTICFSFGINPIATGKMPDFMGGWANVYEHNRGEMVKFVGDLGTGKFGSEGMRPGGFVGGVYDRLDATQPDQAALMAKIRDQTNTVRSLFTHEDFKRGNGDPAKMGREILALQGLAEQALEMVGATDQAATMSKGCKSDKDRGGVTDVELKHKLITEDMGGEVVPDRQLEGDDQANMDVVGAASGQGENQGRSTGYMGSKESGKLTQRYPSPVVRQYLSGMGSLASE